MISKAKHESEQVLEVGESPGRGRHEVFADVILSNKLAKAIAEIDLPRDAEIDAHM